MNKSNLELCVALIRKFETEGFELNRTNFNGNIIANQSNLDAIEACLADNLIEADVDSSGDYNDFKKSVTSEEDKSFKFDVKIKKSKLQQCFFPDFESFYSANNKRIWGGDIPREIYVLREDCLLTEDSHSWLDKLGKIVGVVNNLTKIAKFKDSKLGHPDSANLVFIGYDKDDHVEPIALDVCLSFKQIEEINVDSDYGLLDNLSNESDYSSDPHHDAKISIFNSTVVEYFSDNESSSNSLGSLFLMLSKWNEFRELYQKNLSIYTSGYIFGKIKNEISDKEIEFAELFSKLISDISTKVLSIPISLAVIFFLRDIESISEYVLAIFSLFLLSLVVFLSVLAQQKNFERVVEAKNRFFSKKHKSKDVSRSEMDAILESVGKSLKRNEKFTKKIIYFLACASWLPLIAGGVFLGFQSGFFELRNVDFGSYSCLILYIR